MCIRDRSCASCWVRARRGSGETASPSWFCSFISCLHGERIPIGSAEANLDVLREILRRTTKPNLPLVVPKISYLHHGLLGALAAGTAKIGSRAFVGVRSKVCPNFKVGAWAVQGAV